MINTLFLSFLPLFSFIYEESTLVFCQIPYFCTPFGQLYSSIGDCAVLQTGNGAAEADPKRAWRNW